MILQLDPKTKQVVSYSEGYNKGSFKQVKVILRKKDKDIFATGQFKGFYRRGKIIFEKRERLANQERRDELMEVMARGEATQQDILEFVQKTFKK